MPNLRSRASPRRKYNNSSPNLFKTEQQWRELFKKVGLKLVFDLRIDVPPLPAKKKLFVLEK